MGKKISRRRRDARDWVLRHVYKVGAQHDRRPPKAASDAPNV